MVPGPSPYGVYVHLPWCEIHCHYCAFNVHVDPGRDERAYTDALLRQWAQLQPEFAGPPDTLAFGGGTPSLHPPPLLAELIRAIAPSGEVSMEANPSSTDRARLDAWRTAGVTRLSLGLQTTSSRHRRFLNRTHDAETAQAIARDVIAAGFRSWSVDLIYAIPGQTMVELQEDVDRILALEPPHLSLYGLTVEPGTPLGAAVQRGRVQPSGEDLWADMNAWIVDRLNAAGFDRYEVSNFARPGHVCAQNVHYWRGDAYAGLGVGAHGFMPDGRRTVGAPDPATYLQDPTRFAELARPNAREAASDLVVSTLRHRDGVSTARLARLGFRIDRDRLAASLPADHVESDAAGVRLSGPGWALADAVALAIDTALRPLDG